MMIGCSRIRPGNVPISNVMKLSAEGGIDYWAAIQMNWLSMWHKFFRRWILAGDENTVSTPMLYKLRSACHRVVQGVVRYGGKTIIIWREGKAIEDDGQKKSCK
jgi:hypothetical protein